MGIIEDYLKSEVKTSPTIVSNTNNSEDSIISKYLKSSDNRPRVVIDTTPKPPISGVSKEESEAFNAQPSKQGGVNPRSVIPDSVKNLPSNLITDVVDDVKSGASLVGKGLSDITQNKPASGIGEVGLGALSVAGAPITGALKSLVERPVTDLTGNKNIGEKAAFVVGAGVPVKAVSNVVRNNLPKTQALKTLVDKITSNGREPQALFDTINAMKSNPRVTPADTSPAVLNMAQKLFTTEGDAAKNYLHSTSKNRMVSSKSAIEGAFDNAGGVPVDVVKRVSDLSNASKQIGLQQINPLINSIGPVNISKTLESLDNILKPGSLKIGDSVHLTSVKKELDNIRRDLRASKEYNAKDLNSFQSGLRKTGENLLRSANKSDHEIGSALLRVRNDLVNDIDKASGGKYKPALSNYRDEMHIADAFHDAYNGVFTNSKKLENRPEFTKKWFDDLTDNEKEAAREGARLAIDTEIKAARNGTLAGTNLGKSDFNQERLKILFGEQETNKLLKTLEHERAIANTHNKIIEGSQTEMRHAADAAVALPQKSEGLKSLIGPAAAEALNVGGGYLAGGTVPGLGAGLYIASRGATAAKHKLATNLAKARNLQLAKYAMPSTEEERQILIKSLEAIATRQKPSLLRRLTNTSRFIAP